RGLAQIVDISFEGEPKNCNLGSIGLVNSFFNLVDDPFWLSIVYITCSVDEFGVFWIGGNDEPWVHSNAVATDAWSWLKDVDARVVVCKLNELPDVDAQVVGNKGEFVRECNVDVARSEEHTSELQSRFDLVCRLLLEKK